MTADRSRLSILILHRLGDPLAWRTAVRDLEYLLPDHLPEHDYVVHASEQPLPDFVKQTRFHAIILGPTFLCARFAPWTFEQVSADYAFIRDSDAFKIALPQDDYDCSQIMDRWAMDWRIDALYAACSQQWSVLYPEYSRTGRIHQGYTGYIPDSWLLRFRDPKPHAERRIDVSYRANRLPANYGRIGRIKTEIGERFAAHPAAAGLRLDISTDPSALIYGERWHDFIEDSRFCLAANSGSSLLDPLGTIRRCVEQQLIRNPAATFEHIEAQCFPGEDGRYSFTAISPRNLEAALAHTVQIATPGEYSGMLSAGDHYLPLAPDCSNAPEVVARMRDQALVSKVASQARDAVLAVPELRAATHANRLVAQIADGAAAKRVQGTTPMEMQRVIERYHNEVAGRSAAFWASRRRRQRLRDAAVALGARRVKRWLMSS